MWNKWHNTWVRFFPYVGFSNEFKGQFDGGCLHYDYNDKNPLFIEMSRNKKKSYYQITNADFVVSQLEPSYDDNLYQCRIDYEIEVLDSLNRVHKVEGWATPDPNDERRL